MNETSTIEVLVGAEGEEYSSRREQLRDGVGRREEGAGGR